MLEKVDSDPSFPQFSPVFRRKSTLTAVSHEPDPFSTVRALAMLTCLSQSHKIDPHQASSSLSPVFLS